MASPTQWTTRLGNLTGAPVAFAIVPIYGLLWFIFSRESFDWHGVTTLIVWLMTLLIQRSDRRDTLAIHAKLDELLKADNGARSELAAIDDKEPEEIERVRDDERGDPKGPRDARR
jgi:low affinity Fe/Cu permease